MNYTATTDQLVSTMEILQKQAATAKGQEKKETQQRIIAIARTIDQRGRVANYAMLQNGITGGY